MLPKMDVTTITLQEKQGNESSPGYATYTLTESTTTSEDDNTDVVLFLSSGDLNNIKLLYTLCTAKSSCYLRHTAALVADMAQSYSWVHAINGQNAQTAYGFTADTTSPEVERFNLDLDARTMTLIFSEAVNTSHAHASGISLQGSTANENSYTLSDDTYTQSANGLEVKFHIRYGVE